MGVNPLPFGGKSSTFQSVYAEIGICVKGFVEDAHHIRLETGESICIYTAHIPSNKVKFFLIKQKNEFSCEVVKEMCE